VGVVAARAKSHKSWVAIDLALSATAGKDWLGFACKAVPVVYVNFELSKKSLFHRVKRIAEAKHIDLAALKDKLILLTINEFEIEMPPMKRDSVENPFTGGRNGSYSAGRCQRASRAA